MKPSRSKVLTLLVGIPFILLVMLLSIILYNNIREYVFSNIQVNSSYIKLLDRINAYGNNSVISLIGNERLKSLLENMYNTVFFSSLVIITFPSKYLLSTKYTVLMIVVALLICIVSFIALFYFIKQGNELSGSFVFRAFPTLPISIVLFKIMNYISVILFKREIEIVGKNDLIKDPYNFVFTFALFILSICTGYSTGSYIIRIFT